MKEIDNSIEQFMTLFDKMFSETKYNLQALNKRIESMERCFNNIMLLKSDKPFDEGDDEKLSAQDEKSGNLKITSKELDEIERMFREMQKPIKQNNNYTNKKRNNRKYHSKIDEMIYYSKKSKNKKMNKKYKNEDEESKTQNKKYDNDNSDRKDEESDSSEYDFFQKKNRKKSEQSNKNENMGRMNVYQSHELTTNKNIKLKKFKLGRIELKDLIFYLEENQTIPQNRKTLFKAYTDMTISGNK